ncbi:hypothetical protein CAPTEDRAFT_224548 [Capitella teleta]|uniref:Polypeptide N-acetylgalactosaminyltransferase n=1 Tax=Capitella teleta TaxID=283909 RepID=R7V963_CAPTE|nr:hypothetical protein CAPTEDRAFT_224548 [Capitella teleta]|eukprot:ELU15388.1 hypothetical protein CAPTEDRAFT_224548 [Capitella teleta]
MAIISSRMLRRKVGQILVLSIITTLLLMLFAARQFEGPETGIQNRKRALKEQLRQQRLRELQKTIFVNPNRPPDDSGYNINVTLSERIPLERNVPDSRPLECRGRVFDVDSLPTVSVIIPFYNEALSMLLRTVHSILSRTPEKLLKQVILVNDHSPNADLNDPLERYVKYLPEKVILIKTSKREGLIRARMMGADMATGDVLMFQDGHTENNVQWAEPLLEEIKRNPKVVIQPHVDAIDQWTIQYEPSSSVVPRGGFSWDLRYTWMQLPDHEKERLDHQQAYKAQRTPTLVGCAVMVGREHFFAIGGFDDGMNIWGGENIELAFRNWLCGGEVLNHPCSRVAHTFKPFSYKFDGDREKIVQKNQMRIAELWMDDWKTFFLAATYSWPTKHIPFTEEDRKSLEPRMNMKHKLGCKPFKWYMDNIVPEMPTPPKQAHFYGEVANIKSEACFYLTADGYIGMTFFCFFHRVLPQNLFYIDNDGRLMYQSQTGTQGNKCLRVDKGTWLVKVGPCVGTDMSEKWDTALVSENVGDISVVFQDNGVETKLCMTQVTNVNKMHYREQMPQLLPCEDDNTFQQWRWTYVFDFNYNWENPS